MTTDEPLYTTAQARAVTGASYRQVDYWLRAGYVRHAEPTPGSGRVRRLDLDQVVHIGLLADLSALGVMPRHLGARTLAALRREGRVTLNNVMVTYDAATHRARIVAALDELEERP